MFVNLTYRYMYMHIGLILKCMFIPILFIAFDLWLKSIIYSLQKLYGSKKRNLRITRSSESSQIFHHFVLKSLDNFKIIIDPVFPQALGLVYMYIFFHRCLYIHCIYIDQVQKVWSLPFLIQTLLALSLSGPISKIYSWVLSSIQESCSY